MSRSNQLPNLDKLFKDDEEQDFTPLGGSNLAAIFGASNQLDGKDPQKFQSRKSSSGRSTPKSPAVQNKTDVIIAKVVDVYKLQNGQYFSRGKLGIALTANLSTRTYLLILYKNKQDHISVVTLSPEFSYTVRENNYASYYDGNNENWSILFENTESSIDFAREIGLVKYFLQSKPIETVFIQDLLPKNDNSSESAEEGDDISINCSIVTSISQPLQIKPGSGQTIVVQISSDDTWEQTLSGITKGTRRILIVPPSKQISLGIGFPRDKDIALDIEIVDIKKPDDVIPPPKVPVPGGKAALISRMARMGQSILPKVPASTTTDSEDTEDEVQVKSTRRIKNSQVESVQALKTSTRVAAKELASESFVPSGATGFIKQIGGPGGTQGALIPAGAFTPAWNNPSHQQQYVTTADGIFPVQGTPMMPVDPNVNVFLSETRTHNAEIRMGMNKIADNVQKLLDKFHVLEVQNAGSPSNEKALETTLKMILSLNSEKDSSRRDQSLTSNEKNSSIEAIELRERIKCLESELEITKNSLSDCHCRLERMDTEKMKLCDEKEKMQERIQRLESQLSDAQTSVQSFLLNVKEASDLALKYQKKNGELEGKIIILEAEKKIMGNVKTLEKDKTAEIKIIMNRIYQTLVGKFTEDSYSTDFIKSTIGNTIKAITLQVLEDEKKGETKSGENEGLRSEKESVVLPDLDYRSSGSDTNFISYAQEGPPPIPPIDLDVDDDFLP